MVRFVILLLVSLAISQDVNKGDRVEFNKTILDNPIIDLHFCGKNDEVIFALTSANVVYRSENNGMTWKKLSDILEREATTTLVKEQPQMGKVVRFEESKADKNLIALIGSQGVNWYSDDCGKTLRALNHGRPIYEFEFHPRKREWGLAAAWTKCSDFQKTPCKIYKELYLTKDLGQSWEFLTNYVVQFSWAQQGLLSSIARQLPNERIYVTHVSNGQGHQSLSGWSSDVDMVKSDDFFKSTTTLVPRGNKFLMSDAYIFVAQVVEEGADEVNLMVSNQNDIEKFYQAEIPVKRIPTHSFTLLDTSEGSIFLHVNHYGEDADYGNVYISDGTGRRFNLSLLHNIRNKKGSCDFDKVWGLEGIYMANVVSGSLDMVREDNLKSKNKKVAANKNAREGIKKKTLISFDKGGEWEPLKAPERDSTGKRIFCEDDDCSLHLHSLSYDQFGPFYSTDNAVGVVIGCGNVGSHLSNKADEINTYISQDGGVTWIEIHKGANIYEIGDHGALIVMGDDQKATDEVQFTWNEGMTWETLKISDEPIEIENIVIEPAATSQKFIVYGSQNEKGVIVALDFTAMHEPQCKNPDQAGSSNSDYETWTPTDGRPGSKCLMGHTTTYTRKKRESECYNGEEFERYTMAENCVCTARDFECDINYYRDTKSDTCQLVAAEAVMQLDECESGDFYEIPTGYRRVAGNTCIGGVADTLEPQMLSCSSTFGTILKFVAIVAIFGGAAFAGFSQREAIVDFIAMNIPKITGLFSKDYSYGGLDRVPESAMDDYNMSSREEHNLVLEDDAQGGLLQDDDDFDFDPRV